VTYTLARHGTAEGRPALMIEVRNDLVSDETTADRMGQHLACTVAAALAGREAPTGVTE